LRGAAAVERRLAAHAAAGAGAGFVREALGTRKEFVKTGASVAGWGGRLAAGLAGEQVRGAGQSASFELPQQGQLAGQGIIRVRTHAFELNAWGLGRDSKKLKKLTFYLYLRLLLVLNKHAPGRGGDLRLARGRAIVMNSRQVIEDLKKSAGAR